MNDIKEKKLLSMESFCEYADMDKITAREFLKAKSFAIRISPRKLYVDKAGFDAWVSERTKEVKCDSVFAVRSRRRLYHD